MPLRGRRRRSAGARALTVGVWLGALAATPAATGTLSTFRFSSLHNGVRGTSAWAPQIVVFPPDGATMRAGANFTLFVNISLADQCAVDAEKAAASRQRSWVGQPPWLRTFKAQEATPHAKDVSCAPGSAAAGGVVQVRFPSSDSAAERWRWWW